MSVELSLSSYIGDVTAPLMDGSVEPEGIDLTTIVAYPPVRHRRFFEHGEFDVAEVSLASYLASRTNPERYPFTAIPVFPERKFRHSFLYVRADADIEDPADLAGRDVGIQSWQTTANVWMRGIAAEHYGLDLEAVRWFRRKDDDADMVVPERFDVRPISGPQGGDAVERPDDLLDALFEGRLDAAMDPAGEAFNAVVESDAARLLFDEPMAEEIAYYEETGIFPPMHAVAIRDAVLEEHPWVARSLYDAFVEAKERCFERTRSPSAHTSLVWPHLLNRTRRDVMGDDAWAYGLTDRTRAELETFVRYAEDQGLVPRRYDVADLFVESTLDV